MTQHQQAEFNRMLDYYTSKGEKYSFSELWPRAMKAVVQLQETVENQDDVSRGETQRLTALLSTGLQRYFEKQPRLTVDLPRDESVTTTCPDDGAARNSASDDH